MRVSELNYAVRQAMNNFDKWNEVTGIVDEGSSYYFEIEGVIEDAVRIGVKIALDGVTADLSDILNK